MKSLDQVEARTIVNAANTPGDGANTFIISAPGSYYLTGNITGAPGKHGISIQADNVTLDLNGFALISGGGTFRGVNVPAVQKNLCVRNGTVQGWADGGVRTDLATSTLAEKLRLSGNVGATGLALGNGSARDCVASSNATGFVVGNGAEIKDCTATANTTGFTAGDRTMISSCIATVNTGAGFNCGSFVTIIDSTSSRNGSTGITVGDDSSVIHCNSSRNVAVGTSIGGAGIFAGSGCTIADCTAGNNQFDGISFGFGTIGSTVRSCTAEANGSAGITVDSTCQVVGNTCDANHFGIDASSNGNRIDGNSCSGNTVRGYSMSGNNNLIVRNSAHGNATNYSFPGSATASGPIVDMTAGGTIASTSPWANFSY